MINNKRLIQLNEEPIKEKITEIIKNTVETTINALLDEEANEICNAQKYERSPHRVDSRAGHYQRKFETTSGTVTLNIPKLRKGRFETAIIERYKRREASVEEALMEMYFAGVSVRRVEDITKALWGSKVSPSTISNLNKKAFKRIEEWRTQPIEDDFPYIYLDGIVLKRSWGGEVRNVSILVAVGVDSEGHRRVLGIAEGAKEDKAGWSSFLKHLKSRGLKGVQLIISDACMGLVESVSEFFPESQWQRCTVHFYRNVFSLVPRGKMKDVTAMLKAIHAQEDKESAEEKTKLVVQKLRKQKLHRAADLIENSIHETFTYYNFPSSHKRRIYTNNSLERIMKEIRRRTRVVGSFPDGNSALMLCAARLRHISGTKWSTQKYLNMDLLKDMNFLQEQIA